MGIFKTSSFLDFELCPPFLFIIITSTLSLLVQSTKTIVHNENNTNPNSTITPPPQPPLDTTPIPKVSPFRPTITVLVGIITIILCFTFLILFYAKHCRGGTFRMDSSHYSTPSTRIDRINSGVERTVVESLPTFRFKSLRGQKDGLECAVCLNRFEQTEVLRLLPKCKHAFHMECLDTWLDIHSTCPLCRYRVQREDVLLVDRCISEKNSCSGGSGNILFGGVQAPPTPPPLPPLSGRSRDGVQVSRHSSTGETRSPALLDVIVDQPGRGKRKSTTSLHSSKRSLDGWKSFSKKPSRLSGTKSLDISNELRKDSLLLDRRNNNNSSISSSSSILQCGVQDHGVEQFSQPSEGEGSSGGGFIRHSSSGECGSSSLLKVIAEKHIQNQRSNSMNFLSIARKSFDGWMSFGKRSSGVKTGHSRLSGTRSLDCDSDHISKDGLLLLAKKKANKDKTAAEQEHHRLDHMIVIGGPGMDNSRPEERWSDVQPSEMLYLQSEMILSKPSILGQEGRSRSSDDSKVNDVNDRSVSEMTGLSRFRNDGEQQRHNNNVREALLLRWKAWISKSKSESLVQQPSSSGVNASALTSSNV